MRSTTLCCPDGTGVGRRPPLALLRWPRGTDTIGRLSEGTWHTDDAAITDSKGRFVRKPTTFRHRITADGSTPYAPEAGRYHLFVAAACPWAHRVMITRSVMGLTDAIGLSMAHPLMLEQGWDFTKGHAPLPDTVVGIDYAHQLYTRADSQYTGRATVPVLWDTKTNTIVNNESRELMRMFNTQMPELARGPVLAPADRLGEIDAAIEAIYEPINNAVYRAGFTRDQATHEKTVRELFAALDHWEGVLSTQRFMLGDAMTEADLCLFTTLLRFDPVYVTHFKCNLRRLVDYPNLWGLVRDIYQTPGVAETVDIDAIKLHYFGSHESVNPRRLVPIGPIIDLTEPHGRG